MERMKCVILIFPVVSGGERLAVKDISLRHSAQGSGSVNHVKTSLLGMN